MVAILLRIFIEMADWGKRTIRMGILCACLVGVSFLFFACAGFHGDYPRKPSAAFDRPDETRLGRVIAPHLAKAPGTSGFSILDWGLDAFVVRAALIEAAEKSIDLQYYIIHNDVTGKLLLNMVLRAADRGVKVRILVDDMYTTGRKGILTAFTAHPNIEVRLFNPFAGRSSFTRLFDYLTDFSRVQRRMHNKLFLVDGAAAIVGGRNVGDEYFAAREDVNFADLDLLAIGPVAAECGRAFDLYWNSRLAVPVQAFLDEPRKEEDLDEVADRLQEHWEAEKESEYVRRVIASDAFKSLREGGLPFSWARSRLACDPPEKLEGRVKRTDKGTLWSALNEYAVESKSELIIVSPYFVPGEKGVEHLKTVRDRGVAIRILTNSLASNDVPMVHGGYGKYRKELLEQGIELFEVRAVLGNRKTPGREKFGSAGAGLHAKSFIYDRRVLFVGSANMDPRSGDLNTEMGLIVESPEIATEMANRFDRLAKSSFCFQLVLEKEKDGDASPGEIVWVGKEDGKEVKYTTDPLAGVWRRLSVTILSIFMPESLL